MKKAILSIKIDKRDKKQAQVLARKLGFTLSTLVNAYLKEFLRTKAVKVQLEEDLELSTLAKKQLAEAEKDLKAGKFSPTFRTAEEATAWLHDPEARYADGSSV